MNFTVRDHNGRPVDGDFEFKVMRVDTRQYHSTIVSDRSFSSVPLWRDYAEGNVHIEVWASRLELASYGTEHVRALISNRITRLPIDSVRRRVRGENDFALDPESPGTYNIRVTLSHTSATVSFEVGGNIHGSIQTTVGASGGLGITGLGEITIDGTTRSEYGGELNASTRITAEVGIARDSFNLSQG